MVGAPGYEKSWICLFFQYSPLNEYQVAQWDIRSFLLPRCSLEPYPAGPCSTWDRTPNY